MNPSSQCRAPSHTSYTSHKDHVASLDVSTVAATPFRTFYGEMSFQGMCSAICHATLVPPSLCRWGSEVVCCVMNCWWKSVVLPGVVVSN